MQYCNFLVRVDFLPIFISESPGDGCYMVPAQIWLTTWSTKVAQNSSEITVLGLPHPRPPHPPPLTLTLTPLDLSPPRFPMLASIAPK